MQVVQTYDYYTLDQAKEILREENRIRKAEQRKIKLRRRNKAIYYMKQKAVGLILCVIAILIPIIDRDITLTTILLPFGMFMIFTKQRIIYR